MKIIKSLKKSGLLINNVSETIERNKKKQRNKKVDSWHVKY